MNAPVSAPSRGQPLRFLVILAIGWLGLRFAFWESPLPDLLEPVAAPVLAAAKAGGAKPLLSNQQQVARPAASLARLVPPPSDLAPPLLLRVATKQVTPRPLASFGVLLPPVVMAGQPGAPALQRERGSPAPPLAQANARNTDVPSQQRRLTFDGWLYWRDGSGDYGQFANGPAQLGGSQAGAILSYRLDAASPIHPTAYLRATQAIGGVGESELAFGVKLRPVASVPIDIHAEARVFATGGTTEIRPAVLATGGFDHATLPQGLKARGYGQAGYVGGEFKTGFVDGQVVIDRPIINSGQGSLSIGAGTWGGAQRGASRLDVGPSASISLPIQRASVRISADYRVRVAGDAQPATGPAVTLSTSY